MVKLQLLKKRVIKEAVVAIVILAITGGATFFGTKNQRELSAELARFEREKKEISGKEAQAKRDYEDTIQALSIYKNIPQHRLPTPDGFETYPSRLRVSRPIIVSLKDKYKMILDVSLSEVTEDEEMNKKRIKDLSVTQTEMTIQFEAMSDELAFSFIDELMRDFPGYLQMTRFNITRNTEITAELLNTINQTQVLIPLVSGEVAFIWKTIKEKEEKGTAS